MTNPKLLSLLSKPHHGGFLTGGNMPVSHSDHNGHVGLGGLGAHGGHGGHSGHGGHGGHGVHSGQSGHASNGGHGVHGGQSGHPSNGGHGGLGHGNFCRTALAILARFAFPSAINTSFQRKLHNFFFEP